ncbi:MAG: hypothetical protein RLZZ241_2126 [Bacteroidota bacterium]|jgi:hypothetical protein
MRSLLLLLLLGVQQIPAQSQSVTRQWLGLSYEALDTENSRLNVSQFLRWKDGLFQVAISEADFKTKVSRTINAGLEFRYIMEQDRAGAIQGNRSASRLRFNLYHNSELGRLDLEQRVGIQYYRRFDDGANRLTFRFRPQVTPRIRNFKYDPSLSVEYFKQLEAGSASSLRYGIGIPLEFDRNEFELGYFYEHSKDPLQDKQHIFALKYSRKR